jgi:ribonuclease HI
MDKRKKTAYAVAVGRQPGIYSTWEECREQTDGFSSPLFEGFFTMAARLT